VLAGFARQPYDDQFWCALWLGVPMALKLTTTRRCDRAEQYPTPR